MLAKELPRLGLDDSDHIGGFDEVFVLGIFGLCQRSLICLPAKIFDFPQQIWISAKFYQRGCDFWS
jgi:hypothetical protein